MAIVIVGSIDPLHGNDADDDSDDDDIDDGVDMPVLPSAFSSPYAARPPPARGGASAALVGSNVGSAEEMTNDGDLLGLFNSGSGSVPEHLPAAVRRRARSLQVRAWKMCGSIFR